MRITHIQVSGSGYKLEKSRAGTFVGRVGEYDVELAFNFASGKFTWAIRAGETTLTGDEFDAKDTAKRDLIMNLELLVSESETSADAVTTNAAGEESR